MIAFRQLCKVIALPLAAVMAMASLPLPVAHAALVSTDRVIEQSPMVQDDRQRVMQFLAREDVREQMQVLGVDPDEAAARAAALSDAEVSRIVGQLDSLPAGEGVASTIIIVGAVVFVVLLITDILGLTDIFTFINR